MMQLSVEKILRFLLVAVLLVFAGMVMLKFSLLLIYLLVALILSYLLDPVVNRMQANGMNRTVSILIVLISVMLLVVWASTTILPNIGNQIARLAQQFNLETVRYIAVTLEDFINQAIPYLPAGYLENNMAALYEQLFNFDDIQKLLGNIFGIFTNLAFATIIIPFTTFFFLKDGGILRRQILEFVPNKYFETTLTIISKIEQRIGAHFRGVALQSTLVALFSWLFLSIAGLNNALTVGIAIGLANTIPYFGPVLGYILSIVIAIVETGDFSLVINCIIAVGLTQILDNVVFYPAIFSRTAGIHPLYVLVVILIGAELAGLLGMLVAVPIATILRVIITQITWSFKNYYVFRTNT